MNARLWYLGRGVAWLPVLGCCGAAVVTALLVVRWPDSAGVLVPAALACCVGAAAFVYDEAALPVIAVTPRGAGWRRSARLVVTLVPLSVWALVVTVRPGHVPLARPGWWLLGGATVLLVVGSAALASKRLVSTPGVLLAPVAALAVIAPVTLSGMFTLGSLYPIGDFPGAVWAVWLVVATTAVVVCTAGLLPGDSSMRTWALRLAGLNALVNGIGFGAFDVPAMWHFAHDHRVWYAPPSGLPTYGDGPFAAHGIDTSVPLLAAFLGSCVVLAVGGGLLLVPRSIGVVTTLAGIVFCAPFWWGFDLPFAWLNAATVLVLLALAASSSLLGSFHRAPDATGSQSGTAAHRRGYASHPDSHLEVISVRAMPSESDEGSGRRPHPSSVELPEGR